MSTVYNRSTIHLHNLLTQIQKSKKILEQKIAPVLKLICNLLQVPSKYKQD